MDFDKPHNYFLNSMRKDGLTFYNMALQSNQKFIDK